MAIEFVRVEYVKRSDGKNACCKAAYNARARIPDKNSNVTYTFERLKDNVYHEILLPFYVNERFKNVAELANEVEQKEKKSNSQLYKEYVLALPDNKEIKLEDRVELTRRFIEEMGFVEEGLGVQFDVHRPHDGEKNWHAHLLVTTRRFAKDGQSLDQKARDLSPQVRGGQKHYILDESKNPISILWRKIQDQYFAENEIGITVDERNINAQVHLGPVRMRAKLAEQENLEFAAQKEAKIRLYADELEALSNAHMSAVNDNKEFVEWPQEQGSNVDELKKKTYTPDKPLNIVNSSVKTSAQSKVKAKSAAELLHRLTKSKAIFSQSDILSLVEKINDKQERQSILSQLKTSSELQRLYRVEDGSKTNLFTTQTVRMLEERIKQVAEHVAENSSAGFNIQDNIQKEKITELTQNLSQSQQQALSKILDSKKGVVVLQGRAGTGKSQVLGVLNSIVKDQTCVIALTPTQRAAGELREKGFNKVDTIKGFLFKYRNGKAIVGSSPLFIIDEAGMVDSHSYLELLKVAKSNNARMLLTGDDKQLASIELSGMFKIFAQEYGAIEMDEIRRQESAVDKKIVASFAKGDTLGGLQLLQQQKRLIFANGKEKACEELIDKWASSSFSVKERLILTISNKDALNLNAKVRDILKQQQYIVGDEYEIQSSNIKIESKQGNEVEVKQQERNRFAAGDRIVMTKSDKALAISNGDFGQIQRVSQESFSVRFDDGRNIEIDPRKAKFKHGYAVTVYKSQGTTVKAAFVLHNGFSTKENAYVEISRHAKDLHFYCNYYNTKNIYELADQMQRSGAKVSSLHYYTKEQRDRVFNPVKATFLGKAVGWVKKQVVAMSDALHNNDDYYVFKAPEEEISKVVKVDPRENTIEKVSENRLNKLSKTKKMKQEIKKETSNSNTNSQEKYRKWNDEVERIRYGLKFKAEDIATNLLGQANKHMSSKFQLRFGQQGKMAVDIAGKRAGMWIDFANGVGGDLLELIMREKGLDFKGALSYAQNYTSSTKVLDSILQEKQDRLQQESLKQQQLQDEKKMEQLKALCKATKPLDELGVKYLRNRSISVEATKDIRMIDKMWHGQQRQNLPAIVAFARNNQGKITCAGCIYLDKTLAQKANVEPAKRTLGSIKGSFVEIQQGESQKQEIQNWQPLDPKITILAEGLETALSLREARLPGKILCALGIYNLKNYAAAKDEIVIIAADNDGNSASSKRALDNSIYALKKCVAKTYVVIPKALGEKNIGEKDSCANNSYDFNDVLQQPDGFKLIQQQFMPVITPYLSEQTKAEISALHSSMTQSGRTAKEAMREITGKYEQINNAWKNNNLPVADKNFGVTDFQGKKHTTEYSYFLAIYQDPKISHLIDYQSDLGKQIQQTAEYQLNRDRSLSR